MNVEAHTSNINSAIQAFFTPGIKCEEAQKVDRGYGLVLREFDPNNDNFLFLDIDGVMHPFGTMEAYFEDGKFVIKKNDKSWIENGEPFSRLPFLIHLADRWNLKIVLHSAWRLAYNLTELKRELPKELMDRLVGVTDPLEVHRFPSITKFINGAGIRKYMIVDDDLKDFPWVVQKGPKFAGTDSRLGMNAEIIVKLSLGFQCQNPEANVAPSVVQAPTLASVTS